MSATSTQLDIDTPRLAETVDALEPEQINALPFGAIRLDAEGRVTFYSDVEREASGFREEAIARNFFIEIAPCLDNPKFRNRIDQAMARGSLDIIFDHTSDLPSGAKDVNRRIRVQSAAGGGCWIFTQTED